MGNSRRRRRFVSRVWQGRFQCKIIEDEIYIQDNLTLTLGASYDIFNKKERRQASGSETGDNVNAFNPQIGISYDPSPSFNLYASIGRKIRFPTMRNLYATGVIGPQGDPDLYELGGKWFMNTEVTFEGVLFYNDVKALIIFDNQIGRFEQYEDANIYGVEKSLQCVRYANGVPKEWLCIRRSFKLPD